MERRGEVATIVHEDPVLQVATWRDVVIQRWTRSGTIENVRKLRRIQDDIFNAKSKSKLYLLVWLQLSQLTSLDDETRSALNDNRDAIGPYLDGSVVILEGSGFVSSIVRGLISSQRMLKRSPYPSAVKSSVREAAEFLAPLLRKAWGRSVLPSEIEDVVADLGRRLGKTG